MARFEKVSSHRNITLQIVQSQLKDIELRAAQLGYRSVTEYLLDLHRKQSDEVLVCTTPNNQQPKAQGESLLELYHQTQNGAIYLGDSAVLMQKVIAPESVDLVMTSPPFALARPKEYGNEYAEEYLKWFRQFAEGFRRVLRPSGSLVIDLGGAWVKGQPTRSLYQFELLLMLCKEYGFYLAQDFYWWNPARLPTPAEWVNVRRIRVKDAVNCVWWLSPTPYPKVSNRRVLQPYSISMRQLLKNGYEPKLRPSGHDISDKFQRDNGGAIPPNLIALANTESNSSYQRYCRENGLLDHPARFPSGLPAYFIRMLTDRGDLVLDPFGGSCVTGEVSEQLGRRWICGEISEDYVKGALGRFLHPKQNPTEGEGLLKQPYEIYPPLSLPVNEDEEPLIQDGGRTRPKGGRVEQVETPIATPRHLETDDLHRAFIAALGDLVVSHGDFCQKPLEINLKPPLPTRIRLYIFNVTHPPGGRTMGEHKIQLMVPGQKRGERASFDESDGRIVILAGYQSEENVFVLWDAGMFREFPFSRNVQAKAETVYSALAKGVAVQKRYLRGQGIEIVIAAAAKNLAEAIQSRIEITRKRLTGG